MNDDGNAAPQRGSDKPFRILGVKQIAIGGPDKPAARAVGRHARPGGEGNFVSERENVDEDICQLGHGRSAVEVDLIQPLDAARKPADHATPLDHVGLGSTTCRPPSNG